jgi:hypothetical protein
MSWLRSRESSDEPEGRDLHAALPLASCVSLGKFLNLAGPQFPTYLQIIIVSPSQDCFEKVVS